MEDQNIKDKMIDSYGNALVVWEVDEYMHHQRSRTWYVLGAIVSVGLIIYALATANFLFALIILMIGIITLISTFQAPDRIEVVITTTGVVVGNAFYGFQMIKDFSIVYDPPDTKLLYFDFVKPWQPLVSIPLEEIDPNKIRESLLPFCMENLERSEETLTDIVRRLYKL